MKQDRAGSPCPAKENRQNRSVNENDFTVRIVLGNELCDFIALEGFDKCLDCRIVLITRPYCDDIHIRAVAAFNIKTVTCCDKTCRNCIVAVYDCCVSIIKNTRKGSCLNLAEAEVMRVVHDVSRNSFNAGIL